MFDAEAGEEAVGKYMRGAWAAFAKDPEGGLRGYGWPVYDPNGLTPGKLGFGNTTVEFGRGGEFDGGCETVAVQKNGSGVGIGAPTLSSGGEGEGVAVGGGDLDWVCVGWFEEFWQIVLSALPSIVLASV